MTKQGIEALSELLKIIGQPGRLAILCAILEHGELGADYLAQLSTSPFNSSTHLAILRRGGILSRRREGSYARFDFPSDAIRGYVRSIIDGFELMNP